MKIIKEEVINYVEKYESFDGTIFEDKEECMKYETSACAMLRKRILDMCSSKNDAEKLMGGYEDNQVMSIQVNNQKEIEFIKKYNANYITVFPFQNHDSILKIMRISK